MAKAIGKIRIINVLKEIEFFEDFTEEELTFLASQMSLRNIRTGTVLFNQGDIGDYLLFVVEGNVEVRLETPATRRVIASYGWGSCVGEMSLIDDYPRSASVVVTEPSELLILTKRRFEAMLDVDSRIGVKMLKGLARNLSVRLRGVTGRFVDIA